MWTTWFWRRFRKDFLKEATFSEYQYTNGMIKVFFAIAVETTCGQLGFGADLSKIFLKEATFSEYQYTNGKIKKRGPWRLDIDCDKRGGVAAVASVPGDHWS